MSSCKPQRMYNKYTECTRKSKINFNIQFINHNKNNLTSIYLYISFLNLKYVLQKIPSTKHWCDYNLNVWYPKQILFEKETKKLRSRMHAPTSAFPRGTEKLKI